MKKRNKIIFGLLTSFVLMIGASFAIFTDYVTRDVEASAGHVEIAANITESTLEEDRISIGGVKPIQISIENKSTIETEVRYRILIGHDNAVAEFEVYKASDVNLTAGTPNSGATPISTGTTANPVFPVIANGTTHNETLYLFLKPTAPNTVGNTSYTLDLVAEIKQKDGVTWSAIDLSPNEYKGLQVVKARSE